MKLMSEALDEAEKAKRQLIAVEVNRDKREEAIQYEKDHPEDGYPRVVTAYAESASGPGWGNCPLWVIMEGADRKMYRECIQPEDQTEKMRVLYLISHQTHAVMSAEADQVLAKMRKRGLCR